MDEYPGRFAPAGVQAQCVKTCAQFPGAEASMSGCKVVPVELGEDELGVGVLEVIHDDPFSCSVSDFGLEDSIEELVHTAKVFACSGVVRNVVRVHDVTKAL